MFCRLLGVLSLAIVLSSCSFNVADMRHDAPIIKKEFIGSKDHAVVLFHGYSNAIWARNIWFKAGETYRRNGVSYNFNKYGRSSFDPLGRKPNLRAIMIEPGEYVLEKLVLEFPHGHFTRFLSTKARGYDVKTKQANYISFTAKGGEVTYIGGLDLGGNATETRLKFVIKDEFEKAKKEMAEHYPELEKMVVVKRLAKHGKLKAGGYHDLF